MLSATDAFPDMTPADQRHTPVVGESHFSDIDEDDQEDDAASQSSGIDADDKAHSRAADASVAHDMYDDVAVGTNPLLLSTVTTHSVSPLLSLVAADPGTGMDIDTADDLFVDISVFASASVWGGGDEVTAAIPAPPTADDAIATATSAAATPAASSSPDVAGGTTDGARATATSAAGTSIDVDTEPVPVATVPPTAEHISSFLLHIRRHAAGIAVDPALGAATPTDTAVGTSRGRKRNNASISGPSDGDVSVATDGARASGASSAVADVTAGVAAVITAGAPGITPDETAHSTVAVHRDGAGNPRQRSRKRSRPHSARDHSRMAARIISAHEG